MIKLTVTYAAAIVMSFAVNAQDTTGAFNKIENRNCMVWNQNPRANETISWSGECTDGKAQGKGTLVFTVTEGGETRSETLNAIYANGKREGYGELIASNGTTIKGLYKDDMLNGRGEILYADGTKFSGIFVNNIQDGLGTLTQINGDQFYGKFKGNIVIGAVRMTRKNGMVVTFDTNEKGQPITAQVLTFKNGNKYSGQHKDFVPQGSGVMTYPNGDFYEGAWDKGLNVGLGNYYWKNGDYLFASWRRGLPTSISTLYYKDGRRWIANYISGTIVGNGVMYGAHTGTKRDNGSGPRLITLTSDTMALRYNGMRQATAGDNLATAPDLNAEENYIRPLISGAYILETNKSRRALMDLDRAVEADPSKALAYQLRGRANMLSGHYITAVEDFEMAGKLSALGQNAFKFELKKARIKAASQSAVRYAVNNTKSITHRATIANYPEALRRLKTAKKADPDYPELDRYIKELTTLNGYETALKTFTLPADRCGSAPRTLGYSANTEINNWRTCVNNQFLVELKALRRLFVRSLGGTFDLKSGQNGYTGYKNAETSSLCNCDYRATKFAKQVIANRDRRVAEINALSKRIDDYNARQ